MIDSVTGIGVLVLDQQFYLKRCNLLKLVVGNFSSFLETRELRSLNFGNSHSFKLQNLSFHLEDTSASTLPLYNLTQIFPDWWADRIGVLELALRVITGSAAREGLYSRGRTIVASQEATSHCQMLNQMWLNAAKVFGTVR